MRQKPPRCSLCGRRKRHLIQHGWRWMFLLCERCDEVAGRFWERW